MIFIPFSILYMRAPLGADHFWASLCILGAVFFIFRSSSQRISRPRGRSLLVGHSVFERW